MIRRKVLTYMIWLVPAGIALKLPGCSTTPGDDDATASATPPDPTPTATDAPTPTATATGTPTGTGTAPTGSTPTNGTTPTGPTPTPATTPTAVQCTVTDAAAPDGLHGHTVNIPMADILNPQNRNYMSTGGTHNHSVDVSAVQFTELATNCTVTVNSNDTHPHTWVITMV